MTPHYFDWSAALLFGFDSEEEREAFRRRVEQMHDEERARAASTIPAPPESA